MAGPAAPGRREHRFDQCRSRRGRDRRRPGVDRAGHRGADRRARPAGPPLGRPQSLVGSRVGAPAPRGPTRHAGGGCPLLTGVAVTDALAPWLPGAAWLKWPNDVVVDGPDRDGGPGPRKLAGLLVERVTDATDAVVLGMGVNVDLGPDELPVPTATSLLLEGADRVDRATLLAGTAHVAAASLRPLAVRGRGRRAVRAGVVLPAPVPDARPPGASPSFPATGGWRGSQRRCCADGSLALLAPTGRLVVAAGDVIHLR